MEVKHLVKDRENGCPLGMKCDQCNLYMPAYKKAKSGEVTQEWNCTWNWLLVMQSETKDRVFGLQQAVESSRNESIERQDKLLNIVGQQHAALPRQ